MAVKLHPYIVIFAIVIAVGLSLWMWHTLWRSRVHFRQGYLIKRHGWKCERLALDNLQEVLFHYHAVIGFVCVWEFVPLIGKPLVVEGFGIDQPFLARLAQHLPGFDVETFNACFDAGDVEDSLVVWRADDSDGASLETYQTPNSVLPDVLS